MIKTIKSRKAEGYIDTAVFIISAMLVIALAVRVFPIYIAKQQLDTFAAELMREAEITGFVGSETDRKAQELSRQIGFMPEIEWSKSGKVQLNEEILLTVRCERDIGLFAGFASFPVTLTAKAVGKSEVYWK